MNTILNLRSGNTAMRYQAWIDVVAAGSFRVCLRNIGATIGENVTLNFAVIKAVRN